MDAGDIDGPGQIGTIYVDHIFGCSERCNDDPQCRSFEYSPTEKKCNLNKDDAPTQNTYKDFAFCVKYPQHSAAIIHGTIAALTKCEFGSIPSARGLIKITPRICS